MGVFAYCCSFCEDRELNTIEQKSKFSAFSVHVEQFLPFCSAVVRANGTERNKSTFLSFANISIIKAEPPSVSRWHLLTKRALPPADAGGYAIGGPTYKFQISETIIKQMAPAANCIWRDFARYVKNARFDSKWNDWKDRLLEL